MASALLALGLVAMPLQAAPGHENGTGHHSGQSPESQGMQSQGMKGKGHHGQGGHGGGHAHSSWRRPPAEYRMLRYDNWSDVQAAQRGKALYMNNCASCHGKEGLGQGPVAASLDHKPANLRNNFHGRGGKGDGYLFWRVSEGGQMAPFNSAMPGFKDSLSKQQRWDVLTYIHQAFHGGF